jgi:hypothetical protein
MSVGGASAVHGPEDAPPQRRNQVDRHPSIRDPSSSAALACNEEMLALPRSRLLQAGAEQRPPDSEVGRFGRGAPRGFRTPVLALRGPRPGPLDDGGQRTKFYHAPRITVNGIDLQRPSADPAMGVGRSSGRSPSYRIACCSPSTMNRCMLSMLNITWVRSPIRACVRGSTRAMNEFSPLTR